MSRLYVGVTDNEWFSNLRELSRKGTKLTEVNFWIPSGKNFRALKVGELFLFKLHSPIGKIAGGGIFLRFSKLPLSYAWYAFGEGNGVRSLDEFRKKVFRYKLQSYGKDIIYDDPEIGCVILSSPFFFEESEYIDSPPDWKPGIQQGKTYEVESGIGKELFDIIKEKLNKVSQHKSAKEVIEVKELEDRYGTLQLVLPRLGQSGFRALVADSYRHRCAITGEKLLVALEAAHIKPYSQGGPHDVRNGILLRRDFHILFDRGYIAIVPDRRRNYKILTSSKIPIDSQYKSFDNKELLTLPDDVESYPNEEFLQWHYENIFLK